MATSINLPPNVLQKIVWGYHVDVMNRNDPTKMDRSERPLLEMFRARRKEYVFYQGLLIQKVHRASGLTWENVGRKSQLHFSNPNFEDEMYWSPADKHMGVELPHQDLKNMGFNPMPNGPRSGKGWTNKMSGDRFNELVDWVKELYDEIDESWDEVMDQELHLDGTTATGDMVGLDGLLPLDNTAGTIGGKNRSDPLYRHHVITGSTVISGGSLERDIQVGVRAAERKTKGMKGKIDMAIVGDDWADAYATYAKNNGLVFNADAGKPTSIDIAMPDDGLRWKRIQIVIDPTFASLDAAGLYTGTPWGKRAYFLNSKVWTLAWQGVDKHFSVAPDRDDVRSTRMSWDGRYCPICKVPNQNFVNTIA